MTHGDQEKAKAAKSSKASGKKAGAQGGENGKSSKAAGQSSKTASQKGAPQGKAGGEKAAASSKKGGSPPAKESRADSKAKSSAAGFEPAPGFNNPVIAGAFKHVLKKYPNALRKLTD
jgi:hypothetical protein